MSARTTLALVAFVALLPTTPARSQCLLDGSYVSSPPASYNCAFGLVSWNVQSWTVSVNGSQITVNPVPNGTLPRSLLGTIDCQSGSFVASAMISGGCTETYTLSGQVLSTSAWSGTFRAQYSGSCFGCAGQQWAVSGTLPPTGILPARGVPESIRLDVGPNPFGLSTSVNVRLQYGQPVRLSVYDVAGRLIATLVDGHDLESGVHTFRWNGRDDAGAGVANGVYFVRLQTRTTERVAKLVMLN